MSKSGVEIDGVLHEWNKFSYYYDQEADLKGDIKYLETEYLGIPIPYSKPGVYIIQLLRKRYSDKGKIGLYINNEENYKKALRIVKKNIPKPL